MKRIPLLLLAILLCAVSAHAALHFYEPFDYAETNLAVASSGLWTELNASITNPVHEIRVMDVGISGSLIYQKSGNTLLASGKCGVAYYGSSTAGCEYETILTTLYENGVVWLSWLSVETKGNWMDQKIRLYNDGTEQAWFGCNVDNPGTLHYYGGFWNWVANTRGDRVQGSNTFVAAAAGPATPHLMVMKLDYVNGIAGYYIDPDPGVADPKASAVWYDEAAIDSAAAMPFNRMRLRRANWASTLTYFDEVRVGDTYGDVTPVPEPATLAVVLGALGFAAVRRR